MAVTTWTAGEVLAAADLNDTFASKPTFTYGTATPTADADGAIWYDENDTPPTPKFWDGSAWQPFSSGVDDAVISSPAATGSYTDSGITYNYYTFTASGTLTVGTAGRAQVVVIAGGGGGTNGGGGAGGYLEEDLFLSVGSYTVTIGAGGAGRVVNGGQANSGNRTLFYRVAGDGFARNGGGGGSNTQGAVGASAAGSYNAAGNTGNVWEGNDSGSSLASGGGAASGGGGAGAASAVVTGTVGGNGGAGITSSITGTAVGRAGGGGGISAINPADHGLGADGGGNVGSSGTANTGGGGGADNGSGGSGVVIVRVAA